MGSPLNSRRQRTASGSCLASAISRVLSARQSGVATAHESPTRAATILPEALEDRRLFTGIVGWAQPVTNVTEGNTGTASISASIVRTGGVELALGGLAYVKFTPASATAGADYVLPGGSVNLPGVGAVYPISFGPFQVQKNFTVGIVGDLVYETNEVFQLTLLPDPGSATGVQGFAANHIVAIQDNDTAPIDKDDQFSEAPRLIFPENNTVFSVPSNLENNTDVDMRSLMIPARTRMAFDVDRTAGSAVDTYLRIFDQSGMQLAANNNGIAPGEAASPDSYLEYTFPTTGVYFFGVSSSANVAYNPLTGVGDIRGSTGQYTLRITEAGDPDDQIAEALTVAVPAVNSFTTVSGNKITRGTDVDMFKVSLTVGQKVTFDVDANFTTAEPPKGPLNSQLRVFNSGGTPLATNDDGMAPGEIASISAKESFITFVAPSTGSFFISVSGSPNRLFNAVNGAGDIAGSGGPYKLVIGNQGLTNLISNGDFAKGNTGFTSQYVYGAETGGFKIARNPMVDFGPQFASFADHSSSADGLMYMADGALVANKTVWQQSVAVKAGATYNFAGWVASMGQLDGKGIDPSPARLAFYVNGVKIGATFYAPANTGVWSKFSANWNAGSTTTVVVKIVDLNTTFVGNDFTLDDLVFARTA